MFVLYLELVYILVDNLGGTAKEVFRPLIIQGMEGFFLLSWKIYVNQ